MAPWKSRLAGVFHEPFLPLTGPTTTARKPASLRVVHLALSLFLILCVAALVIYACYFFSDPLAWWKGFKKVLAHNERGHPAFLMGHFSQYGWWYFFLVALVIKTPICALLAVGVSISLTRLGKPFGRREVFFTVLPVGLYLGIAMCSQINIGLRHILPIYPFLMVIGGRAATLTSKPFWLWPTICIISLALTAGSVLRIAPHHLAYFNEIVGGPEGGYLYLGNSNLDWGQDVKGIKRYMDSEGLDVVYLSYFGAVPPAYYGIRYQPLPDRVMVDWQKGPAKHAVNANNKEILVISVSNLQGFRLRDKTFYSRLLERRPLGNIGYSIYIYDITNDVDAHLHLARCFLAANDNDAAAVEISKAFADRKQK